MTAEIAILNKSAIALATDSAVTISAGNEQQKIYDSGDKLFELSHTTPICIMLYNGMNFMEIPFPSIIKSFRDECCESETVEQAAQEFLKHLDAHGKKSPKIVLGKNLAGIIDPILKGLLKRFRDSVFEQTTTKEGNKSADIDIGEILDIHITDLLDALDHLGGAKFVGLEEELEISNDSLDVFDIFIEKYFPFASDVQKGRLVEFCSLIVKKEYFSPHRTGIVFAGFGHGEQFPTLVAFETDGMLGGYLKYRRMDEYCVDVDREGVKAAVLPFAQKDMVDKFLYGLDDEIQGSVELFCKESISAIGEEIFNRLNIDDAEELEALKNKVKSAETQFLKSLHEDAFETIRKESRVEIEDMVEFMPKSEMAKMAESLIELTSIKHRVSRGMETVGGPVDVAVISQAEGFVWVKRKHYFPAELNARYYERLKNKFVSTKIEEEPK